MTILELKNVVKGFSVGFIPRRRVVLHDVSLAVEQGEAFGFLGPNGAGKTTAIKLAVGLLHPDGGTVRIRGRDVADPHARDALGFLPENPYFYDYLTGTEFLDFFGRLYGLDAPRRVARRRELQARLGLEAAAGRALRQYSKGMLQRIGLAQALLPEPDLLVLDEPMSGLDPVGRRLFRDIMLAERERGATIFFSSHILQDAEMICDRVAILVDGRLRSVGRLEQLLERGGRGYELSLAGEPAADVVGDALVVARGDGSTLLQVSSLDEAERIIDRARAADHRLLGMVPARATLEDLFLAEIGAEVPS